MTTKLIGRRLEQKPFLDIFIIPGENSDPELLKFKSDVKWIDNKSFEINLEFE